MKSFAVVGVALTLALSPVCAVAGAPAVSSDCKFTTNEPETYKQLRDSIDAALKGGFVRPGDFVTVCGMDKDGWRGRAIPVFGNSGPNGVSPTISLHWRLPSDDQGKHPRVVLTYGELIAAIHTAHAEGQAAQITIFDKYVNENIVSPVVEFNSNFGIVGSSTEHPVRPSK